MVPSTAGSRRGGPAKVSVLASGLSGKRQWLRFCQRCYNRLVYNSAYEEDGLQGLLRQRGRSSGIH